jgi:heterotetrameric sarcosine oxidase delta subunit
MIINHPLLGPRDISEFVYLGDASLLKRPAWDKNKSEDKFYEYLYLRNNVAGIHKELWFHQHGDRSWLVVTRNTITHEITDVQLAKNMSMKLAK